MDELDETDRAILRLLQTDAREITNTDIGTRIGVSSTTVGDRIEKLRERGVLRTTYADIDYREAGVCHTVVLSCTAPFQDLSGEADALLDLPGVVTVREFVAGERNLRVQVVGQSREELERTVARVQGRGVEVHDVELLKRVRRRPFPDLEAPAGDA